MLTSPECSVQCSDGCDCTGPTQSALDVAEAVAAATTTMNTAVAAINSILH
jgi:hypothetical protein